MDGDATLLTKPHRFSVADYHAMAEAGVLDQSARVELLYGHVVDMAPIGTPHMNTVIRLTQILVPLLAGRAVVSVQNGVRLDDYSEPQPDFAVLRPDVIDDDETPCRPADVFLLIEVADSSLEIDRQLKAALYAENLIPEYWIVNLPDRAIEVHRAPSAGRYTEFRTVTTGSLDFAALPGLTLSVDAILHPRR